MKIDDITLVCLRFKGDEPWTVYPKNITGLVVQVDDLKDAPKELAKSFEVMLKYGFDKNLHEIHEL